MARALLKDISTAGLKKMVDRGGFESIDGMHPTGGGYAFFAHQVMTLLNLPNNDLSKLSNEA